jgi:quercetin 2,3-dioxygenase
MKKIIGLRHADEQHWVGDGYPVRTLFSYQSMGEQLSPFFNAGLCDSGHISPKH